MMKLIKLLYCVGFINLIFLLSCSKDESSDSPDASTESSGTLNIAPDVPSVYSKIYNASDIYLKGSNVIIQVNGVPDHNSPYYSSNDEKYEAYNGSNDDFNLNPNRISSFDFTFSIPINPSPASKSNPTQLGSIGVAINGVSFYNQYAGPNNKPLTDEIDSFDQFNGHPQQQGVYHYHLEPTYLTSKEGKNALMGFLLDGYPVYGPLENGLQVTNSDLDEFHGHSHETEDFPNGTYHYHITDQDPYINGSGYYGTPGTVTQ